MDTTAIMCIILALLLLYYLTRIIKSCVASAWCDHHRGNNGLNLPPGPWKLPVIGSLHHLISAHPHRALRELSRRHGPLMFLKFGEVPAVVASSREAAKEVMKTHDSILSSRPQTATVKIINRRGTDIVLAPYGDHWRQLRKICMVELLCAKRVQSFRAVREEEAMRLVQAISSSCASASASASASSTPHRHVNLSKLLALYANDSAVRSVMGDRLSDRSTFLRYVNRAITLAGTFRLADLFPSSQLACALSRMNRKAEVLLDGVYEYMDAVISEHVERRSAREGEAHLHQKEDMTDVLLRIQKQGGSLQHPITMGTVKSVLFDLLSGGTESVTSVLQWALAELLRNPDAMSRAQSEVRTAFMGQTNKVTEDGLGKLCYLQWVMKETLRLHTPGPILLPRESQEACRILGYDVPKGTLVIVNAWAISRDPEYWEEPEAFRPERFETDKRDFKGHDFEFTPFGAGRRICPGISFALTTIQLALANLLFHFDWELPVGVLASELDMEETMGLTAKKKTDLWVKPVLRVPFVSGNTYN